MDFTVSSPGVGTMAFLSQMGFSKMAAESKNSSSSPMPRWDDVEEFNIIFTITSVAIVGITLLCSLWRSTFRSSIRLDGPVPDIPTTTFDLSKATFDELKVAVDGTVAFYRGTPINEASYKRSVRWRIRVLLLLSLVMIGLNAFTFSLSGPLARREGFHAAIAADVALWTVLLGITLRPLRTHEGWGRIGQLSMLTVVAATTHVVRILIPLDTLAAGSPAGKLSVDIFQAAAIPISLFSFAIALTIPSGPLRSFASKEGAESELLMMSDQDSGASVFTMLYVGWCTPMMVKAKRLGYIGESDVPVLSVSMRAAVLHAKMTLKNRSNAATPKMSTTTQKAWRLLISLFRTNDRLLVVVLLTEIVGSALFYLPPYLLWKIVSIMEESEANNEPRSLSFRKNLVFIVAFFVGQLVQIHAINIAAMTSMATLKNRIKAQLNTLLLSKALRRKDFSTPSDKDSGAEEGEEATEDSSKKVDGDEIDIGSKSKILALHTIDVQRVLELVNNSFFVINAPVEVITGATLLYGLLGVGGFIGLAMSVIPIPIVYFISKAITRLQDKLMAARDKRTAALNESVQAIRMVKLGAWEDRMEERVNAPRRREMHLMRILFILEAFTRLIGLMSPILIVVTAFVWSTLVEGRKLTPGIAFASFAVLKELRYSIEGLPQIVTEFLQCFVSLRRVALYLESPEIDVAPHEVVDGSLSEQTAVSVSLKSANIGWPVFSGFNAANPVQSSPFCLRDLSIDFVSKELNLICGRIGSGKSLLLLSLLGEAELLAGRVSCPRSPADATVQSDSTHILQPGKWLSAKLVAFAPQQAVILNGSIRFNILWGLPMDRKRYDATIAACALLPDLAAFEDGDSTEIGEGGIGLSGGQKARVGLARAVYSRAQTLLLDDILSAVDAHTAAHINKTLIRGPLLKNRTVLLVSHQVQLLAPSASLVVLLDDGKLQFKGPSDKFLDSEHYSGLLNKDTSDETLVPDSGDDDAAKQGDTEIQFKEAKEATTAAEGESGKAGISNVASTQAPEQARTLVSEEKRERGTIGRKVWMAYYKACGGTRFVVPTLVVVLFSEVWTIVPAAWLAFMTTDTARRGGMNHPLTWWLGGYAGLSVLGAFIATIRGALIFVLCYKACRQIFYNALRALFRAPMRYHDTTPRGRIMSRFGSDVQVVDEQLVGTLSWFFSRSIAFVLSCIVVSVEGSPLFLAIIVILFPAYNWVSSCFRIVVRDVRRMGQTTKSPVAQTFTDVLSGLAVIRAFGSVETTMQTFYHRLDHNIRFDNLQMHRWVSTAMSTFTAIQLFVAGCFIAANDNTSAATAAFALSFLLDLGGQLQAIVSVGGQLEAGMVCVERLAEFAEITPEAATIVEPRPPKSWPQAGEVEFKDLRVRYAPELPDVLKGVSFKVAGGSKVGIVGPTGCGKSTTVTSLFRFVEFSGGSIEIDGIDISKIGLKDLRSRIQIVPQDPVILSGTLREAVDILNERTDAEILEALRKVHLIRPTPASSPRPDASGDADTVVEANGKTAEQVNGSADEGNKVSHCL
ncbi:hypothetical protein CF327_g7475, partial [Tilletia walkeri]